MSRDLILYLGDESYEQAAEAAGWTAPFGQGSWFHNTHDAVESAEEACKVSGVEPAGDVEIILPYRFEICPACEGCGTDRGRSVECDGGGFTSDEWAEQDEDFREDYLAGRYDQPCGCEAGKVRVPDYNKMTKAQITAWEAQQRDDAEIDAIERMERRMGA